jgi:hypothetical protein
VTPEVVRGKVAGAVADEVMAFWAAHGLLTGEEARARAAEVVCVLRTEARAVGGVNSVYEAHVPPVGNRRFWIYRRFLAPPATDDDELAMIAASFDALATERVEAGAGPVGLCVLVDDRRFMKRHLQAEWPDVGMVYAGYLQDGRQVRIRYFEEVSILP